ncbi:putative permease [Silvibacterium bohemicum]|uniref:Putative permease n=1 Tax=Silvibacterium bohemicum TaxID=1577686 RepID=A0A841JYQ5_9BACT|nr:ABC transporter permease [Silvibacterium bohemicum]MBB6145765.1 putative permease [Silvibacterium bohemicum]
MHEILAALRQLRKSPGFAVTVILTLALGIGANTAIFTLVHAVLLRSLPVSNPKMLYRVGSNSDEGGESDGFPDQDNSGDFSLFSYELYQHIRDTTPAFAQLAAMQSAGERMSVRHGDQPARAERTEYVSGNYFETLGIGPFAGRLFSSRDDTPEASPAAVISYAAWQSSYGGDPAVVGQTFTFQGHPFTIVGIAPSGFYGDRIDSFPPAFWIPLSNEPLIRGGLSVLHTQNANWLYLLGRAKPGINAGVAATISTNLRLWLATVPAYNTNGNAALIARQHVELTPGGEGIQNLQKQESKGLYLLMAICALVLLVACANVANLLLARGSAHRADVSLRMALGASRTQVIRQMLTESVLLACLGGLAGLTVAYAGTRLILSLAFPNSPQLPIDPHPSVVVLGFAFLLSLVTGVIFGMVPAWITSHADPAEALRGVNRSTQDRTSLSQRWLIVFQAGLSIVLLVSAGLLTRSLANLQNQNLGVDTANRYIVHLDPLGAGYTAATAAVLDEQLQQRFAAQPNVASVGLALYSPLEQNEWGEDVYITGRTDSHPMAIYDRVSPQFFMAVGQKLIRGRVFTDDDTKTSPMVAVVNQAFAKQFFPGKDPVGLSFGTEDPKFANAFRIVGVVADAKYGNPSGGIQSMFFRPLKQERTDLTSPSDQAMEARSMIIGAIVLQFKTPPQDADGLVRRTLADINPNLTVSSLHTFQYQVEGNFNTDRLLSRLALLFGVLALVLAAVGLYGITSYQVSRRTSEIGVRMALGATRNSVLWLVLRGAFRQVGLGLLIGIPVALLAARTMASQLYNVRSYDPMSVLLAAGALLLAAAIAGIVPAQRAASIEPVTALRTE